MFIWCAVLFGLGILSFLDAILANNEIFGRVSSVFFMLISLALLIRTSTKHKKQRIENYEKRIFSLEREVATLKQAERELEKY
ncbi:MAG: hypothetical protein JSU65_00530 [Candidatus Zixiibacteriota bacterium]|nr:MAG: hypothetical protein JSU65_00530 [candidate division Zixibacteria bacterium]